jgi:hypothetical protein
MKAKAFLTVDKTKYREGNFHPYVLDIFPSGEVNLHDAPQLGGYNEPASVYDRRQLQIVFCLGQSSMTIKAGRKFFRENADLFRTLFAGWTIDVETQKGHLTADAARALDKIGYLAYSFDSRN